MATKLSKKVLRKVLGKGRGEFAYRRTPQFLNMGKLYFKKSVKAVLVTYNLHPVSAGLRYFLAENVPQIQFKNPLIQIMPLKDHGCEFPSIKVYFEDGKKATIDCTGKENDVILRELTDISGKLQTQVQREAETLKRNPANFGNKSFGHDCICTMPGQVPCTALVPRKVEHAWMNKNKAY